MKSKYACLISAVFLVLLFFVVNANRIYTQNTANTIISALDASFEELDALTELRDYWESRRNILNLTHSEPELDHITELFDEIIIYAKAGNAEEYAKTTACIKHAVANLREIEEFSIKNIF